MTGTNVHGYELVYIVQPQATEDAILGFNQRLTDLIASQNGEVTNTEMWGLRTLAYPITKFFEGHYVLLRFQMDPAGSAELDRVLGLSEDIIRYLIVRTDE